MKEIYKGHHALAEMISGHISTWREALVEAQRNAMNGTYYNSSAEVESIEKELKFLHDVENAVKYELEMRKCRY